MMIEVIIRMVYNGKKANNNGRSTNSRNNRNINNSRKATKGQLNVIYVGCIQRRYYKEPLTVSEVKKILRVLDLAEYSQYRDYVIMLVILDCGVKINELLNVAIEDYNSKDKTITIKSETAKTGETRVLPISLNTARQLQRLIDIAEANNEEYIFNSTYGGRIITHNVIKNFEKYG